MLCSNVVIFGFFFFMILCFVGCSGFVIWF